MNRFPTPLKQNKYRNDNVYLNYHYKNFEFKLIKSQVLKSEKINK